MSGSLYEGYKEALRRGHVAALRGRHDVALQAYREAARIAPDRALPYVGMGGVLAKLDRADEALAAYRAALSRAPDEEGALRGRADRFEQCREIVLEIAIVGEPGLGLEVEADLDVVILELQRFGEARQRAQRALAERLRLLVARQAQQCDAQLRREQRWKRSALRRLETQRLDAGGFGIVAHPIEQHRLADTPQADHQNALGR